MNGLCGPEDAVASNNNFRRVVSVSEMEGAVEGLSERPDLALEGDLGDGGENANGEGFACVLIRGAFL
jgi:hypothetical protein